MLLFIIEIVVLYADKGSKFMDSRRLDFPVDIVYLWCNSNDKQWRARKNEELKKYNKPLDNDATNECRFINNDELIYSLRSLEKYASWINNIFIVTDNQIPEQIDTDNPKIHIIDHTQILPKEALPTFNASAIETALHNISNLSEHFLFANDDMFFGRPVSKNFFFNEDGFPIFRFAKRRIINKPYYHLYGSMVHSAYALVENNIGKSFPYFPHHNIDAYRKSDIEECVEFFKEGFVKTANQKFREKDCIQRSIYEYYAIAKKRGECKIIDNLAEKIKAKITNKGLDALQIGLSQKKLPMLNKYNPALFCINDSKKTTDSDRLAMRIYLEKRFPMPSAFEKKSSKTFDIRVCYHKDFTKIENDILKPIIVGAKLSDVSLDFQRDDEGENISDKNPYYSELTALYWLWKNSAADYKGLVHYRRFFDFGQGKVRWIDKIPTNYTEMFCMTQTNISYLLDNYDIILPMKRFSQYKSNYSQYQKKHVISDLDKVLEIIKNKYPQMFDIAEKTMKNTNVMYLYNMFVSKKEFFDEYSAWLFDILGILEKEIQSGVEKRSEYQKRVYGFLSERLFTIYVEYLKTKGLKVLEVPVIYCETNEKRFRIFQIRTKIYSFLVKLGIRNPRWNEKYGV